MGRTFPVPKQASRDLSICLAGCPLPAGSRPGLLALGRKAEPDTLRREARSPVYPRAQNTDVQEGVSRWGEFGIPKVLDLATASASKFTCIFGPVVAVSGNVGIHVQGCMRENYKYPCPRLPWGSFSVTSEIYVPLAVAQQL